MDRPGGAGSGDPASVRRDGDVEEAPGLSGEQRLRLLATAADPEVRDPERALAIARDLTASVREPGAALYDTLAASLAASGDFPAAIEAARIAVEQAGSGNPEYAQRLASYEASQPYIAASAAASSGGEPAGERPSDRGSSTHDANP